MDTKFPIHNPIIRVYYFVLNKFNYQCTRTTENYFSSRSCWNTDSKYATSRNTRHPTSQRPSETKDSSCNPRTRGSYQTLVPIKIKKTNGNVNKTEVIFLTECNAYDEALLGNGPLTQQWKGSNRCYAMAQYADNNGVEGVFCGRCGCYITSDNSTEFQ
jgi:hypothetical protein